MIPPEWMNEANLALHRTLPYLLTLVSAAAAFELLPPSWQQHTRRPWSRIRGVSPRRDG